MLGFNIHFGLGEGGRGVLVFSLHPFSTEETSLAVSSGLNATRLSLSTRETLYRV